MRAVKDGLPTPYGEGEESEGPRLGSGLMARHGRSIAKQSEGGAGEKAARRERVNLITKERKSSVPYWEPQLSFL